MTGMVVSKNLWELWFHLISKLKFSFSIITSSSLFSAVTYSKEYFPRHKKNVFSLVSSQYIVRSSCWIAASISHLFSVVLTSCLCLEDFEDSWQQKAGWGPDTSFWAVYCPNLQVGNPQSWLLNPVFLWAWIKCRSLWSLVRLLY